MTVNVASTTSQVFTGGSVSVGYGYETAFGTAQGTIDKICLLYTSPSPRDGLLSRMPSSA